MKGTLRNKSHTENLQHAGLIELLSVVVSQTLIGRNQLVGGKNR